MYKIDIHPPGAGTNIEKWVSKETARIEEKETGKVEERVVHSDN